MVPEIPAILDTQGTLDVESYFNAVRDLEKYFFMTAEGFHEVYQQMAAPAGSGSWDRADAILDRHHDAKVVGVALSIPDVGGSRAMQQTYMTTHGMTSANNTVLVDGLMVNGLQTDGQVQSYFNDAMNQEVSYQTSGIGADTSAGGVRLNMIPKEGGNTFSGAFFSSWRDGRWQATGSRTTRVK